jgi:pyroglutamyl-peptidase
VSNTAGTFVCNHVFYALMHRLATDAALAHARGGFVHVPFTPQQVASKSGVASMPLASQIDGIRAVLRCAVAMHADVRETAGKEQ